VKTISLKKVSAVAVAALAFGGLTSIAPAQASGWLASDFLACKTAYSTSTCTSTEGGRITLDSQALDESLGTDVTSAKVAAGGTTITENTTYYFDVTGATLVSVDDAATADTLQLTLTYGDTAGDVDGIDDSDGLPSLLVEDAIDNNDTTSDSEIELTYTRSTPGSATVTMFYFDASGMRVVAETQTLTWIAAGTTGISAANSKFVITSTAAGCVSAADTGSESAALAAATRTSMSYSQTAANNRGAFACLIVRDGNGGRVVASTLDSVTVVTTHGSFTSGSVDRADAYGDLAVNADTVAMNTEMFGDSLAGGDAVVSVTVVKGSGAFTLTTKLTYYTEITKLKLTPATYSATPADSTAFGLDYSDDASATTKGDTTVFAYISGTDAAGRTVAELDIDGDGDNTADDTIYTIVDTSLAAGSPSFSATAPADVTEAGAPTFTSVLDTGADTKVKAEEQYLRADINASTLKAQKITLKVCIDDKLTAGTQATICSDPIDVYLAGAADAITVTPAATSVAAGGSTTVNIKATDANGYPVADGTSISLLASNGSSVAPSSQTTVNGTLATAATVVTSTGAADTTVSAVSGGKTGSAKVTLTGGSSTGTLASQIDALNAKIVALNALIAKIMKKLGVK
jgi:hypothetical protein